ncbi:hypothetical protein T03_1887 [Trichinella britovi]|uniref:Uncharacterized protein n=1 Tax=Trichinella britovi TaxID=45882 RepID=A0A0V1AI11_TRIBR|nr:hypothetical protein T03_1887 [Trichinella britovi]
MARKLKNVEKCERHTDLDYGEKTEKQDTIMYDLAYGEKH